MKNLFFVKFIHPGAIVTALLIFPFFTNSYAQNYTEITTSNGQHVRIDNPKRGVYSVVTKDGNIQPVHQENPDEVVRIIVTFKDPPLTIYRTKKSSLQKSPLSSAYTTLQASHESFRTALNTIRQQLSAQLKSDYGYTIKRDYYRALNGVALQCKRGMIDKIRALSMVKDVSLDRELKANLKESVHQIRADIVQDSLGITGKGVLVGDIDTGIDYNNPALGGGFGLAFRVIGGYDFVNNDSDPMDDEGHGTHVAGIIGANGGDSLRGVAPDVKLLAVKVLDATGLGYESDIIAGIDYCLDPDGNPATDDAVDVINMSLGGTPVPDNPLDRAVNNATNAGVLSVIAAGNSGALGYGTIGSPGTSKSALTVGACDSLNNIANFSSVGPDPINSLIKPEVVAPGVNILSTVLNNQTESWSGTSMATPHITGVAALLKEEHPLWNPEEIKAAIVNTAHSVGESVSVFAQGKGIVDALDAAKTKVLVEPGVISFGMVDLEQATWKDTINITVKNLRSTPQNIQVSVIDGTPAEATLTFDKTSFSLPPEEETNIQAILSVPSSVPVVSSEPFAYPGTIKVASDSDNVTVPFSFIKSAKLIAIFNEPAITVGLIDRTNKKFTSVFNGLEGISKYSFNVVQGIPLEILTLMSLDTLGIMNYYIIDHKINNVAGLTYAFIGHNEATFSLIDTLYNTSNNIVAFDSIATMDLDLRLSLPNDNITGDKTWLDWGVGLPYTSLDYPVLAFISPLDSSFSIEKKIAGISNADFYSLKKTISGLQSLKDIQIASGPDNLIGYHLNLSYNDPYITNPPPNFKKMYEFGSSSMTLTLASNGFSITQSGRGIDIPFKIDNVYYNKQGLYQTKQNDKYFYSSNYISMGYRPYFSYGKLRTWDFNLNNKGEALFDQIELKGLDPWSAMGGEFATAFNYETLKPGDTIKVEQNSHVNFPDYMSYIRHGSLFMKCNNNWFNNYYSYGGIKQFNGVTEVRLQMSSYWNLPLYSTQVFSHNRAQTNMKPFMINEYQNYNPSGYDDMYAIYEFGNMQNNAGTLQILSAAHPYAILGQASQCTADFEYNVPNNLTDKNIFWSLNLLGASVVYPSFNLLQVSLNGKAVDNVEPGQPAIIRVIPFDHYNNVSSVNISLILASGDEIVLPVTNIGNNEYDATIPDYLPKGFIDVAARIEDTQGNKCELNASPGFYFGNISDNIKLDARLRMTSYTLNNVDSVNFNTGDTLNYILSYTNFGSDIARNVVITFPATQYFKPVGSTSWTLDSLAVNDTVDVPVSLAFLGKQQSTDEYTYYSPSVTWTSGGTTYLRKHNVLVDFQNTITGIEQTASTIPDRFELYQNYPNPFNPSTTIKYDLAKETRVKLVVYDILGREVSTLVDETQKSGSYQVVWNPNRFASGVYLYRLQAGDYSSTKKLLLLK